MTFLDELRISIFQRMSGKKCDIVPTDATLQLIKDPFAAAASVHGFTEACCLQLRLMLQPYQDFYAEDYKAASGQS